MTKPQQPELRRSERGATDQDSAKAKVSEQKSPAQDNGGGPVPPSQQPGWTDRG
jgi:hypothetical protein